MLVPGAFYWQELGLHERDDCSEALGVAGSLPQRWQTTANCRHRVTATVPIPSSLWHITTAAPILEWCASVGAAARHCTGWQFKIPATWIFAKTLPEVTLDWAIQDPALTTIYLSSMGPMYLNQKQPRYVLRDNSTPNATNNRIIFANALDKTIAMLLAANKKVVLVIDWPVLGFDPKNLSRHTPGAFIRL